MISMLVDSTNYHLMKMVTQFGLTNCSQMNCQLMLTRSEFFNYYVKRAYHPRAINSAMIWDATSPWGYYNFPLQQRIEKIIAPKLIVTGAAAHSRYIAENAYERLAGQKELVEVPGATHTDLYDQMDKIPFDKFESFFKENLK